MTTTDKKSKLGKSEIQKAINEKKKKLADEQQEVEDSEPADSASEEGSQPIDAD